MPIFDKLAYEKFYSYSGEPWGHINTRDGILSHYNEFVVGKGRRNVCAPNLARATGMASGARCLIVGAGFGWICEGLKNLGIESLGTEISEWILAEKDNTEEADVRGYITKVGIDPDNDEVIGDPRDSRTVVKVPAYKQVAWDSWIVNSEADKRREMVGKWALKTEKEKQHYRRSTGQLNYNPKMPTGPKPEWMINPLEMYLKGGRANPQGRTTVIIADEDGSTKGSRTTMSGLMSSPQTHIITEEVLNSISDADGLVLCERLAQLSSERGGEVYHVLSPLQKNAGQVKELNWKSYQGWRNHLNANGFGVQKIVASVEYKNTKDYEGTF